MPPPDQSILLPLLQGGSFGLLAALLVYLMVWGVPAWLAAFKEERAKDREERASERAEREKDRDERARDKESWAANFRADRQLDRDAATTSSRYMVDCFKAEAKEAREAAERMATEERDSCERRHAELMQAIRDESQANQSAHKETRHGLANMANAVGLKKMAEQLDSDARGIDRTAASAAVRDVDLEGHHRKG